MSSGDVLVGQLHDMYMTTDLVVSSGSAYAI
jgi:hypothetical protein